MSSPWLNYHHLLYFWTVAREGSISAASKQLRLAQPTISTQLKTLEDQLGVVLFDRSGRKLELTETGVVAFRYADSIFSLGREMMESISEGSLARLRLTVGITPSVPKLVSYRLIEPALANAGLQVTCQEDRLSRLVARLASHEIDLILADAPLGPDSNIKAFNHVLGQSAISFFATPSMAKKLRRDFPRSLDGARMLLPLHGSMVRRELDRWFEAEQIRPEIVGEIEDSALIKVFGQSGVGAFAGPSVIEAEIEQQYQVRAFGRTDAIHERFFGISVERRIRHPGVIAISETAKAGIFATEAEAE
ncbi:transcriptional activator NhaR [Nannocystaceae bacterium ST9]